MDPQHFISLDQALTEATAQLRDGLSKVWEIRRGGCLPPNGLLSLSVGLELLMKVVISLHASNTDGRFLTPKELKRQYGHSLEKSFNAIHELLASAPVVGVDLNLLSDDLVSMRLLKILTDFGEGGRFHAFDSLTSTLGDSPNQQWRELETDVLGSHPREANLLGSERSSEAFEVVSRELLARIERLARVLSRLFTLGHLGADGKRLSPHVLRFAGVMDRDLGTRDYGPTA